MAEILEVNTAESKLMDDEVVFGNLIKLTKDFETEVAATKEKVKITKGTRGVITSATPVRRQVGGDPIVLLENGYYVPLTTDGKQAIHFKENSDFDLNGCAAWIANSLVKDLKLSDDEMSKLKEATGVYEKLGDVVMESIAKSLCDLGFAADKS